MDALVLLIGSNNIPNFCDGAISADMPDRTT